VAASYALERFAQRRIAIPQRSRLERARAIVQLAHAQRSPPPSRAHVAEATRTIFEMFWIARSLKQSNERPEKDFARKLAAMLAGPDLPRDEDDNSSKARNLQFELFVGAWLTAGGVSVCPGEPDLLMLYLGERIGVPAKRVRSRRKFLPRVKAAAKQLRSHKLNGIVAINVDCFLDSLHFTEEGNDDVVAQFERQVPELKAAKTLLGQMPTRYWQ
jgi:hypothetical protein